jgi:hypothetical protein
VVKIDDQFAIIDHDRYYTRLTKSLDKQLFLFSLSAHAAGQFSLGCPVLHGGRIGGQFDRIGSEQFEF